jgi:glutamyl-tRNA synthetase
MIKTRFSPSPTGMIHIGNGRAALFSALYAENAQGDFLLRIEDTDAVRSEQKFVDILQDDLQWLGINWQEGPIVGGPNGPYYQSQRQTIYADYYQQLEDQGRAYPCFCTDQELALNRKLQLSRGHAPRYPGTCRKLSKEEVAQRLEKGLKPALRFYVPQEIIEFVDLVKGPQKFDSYDIGDFIIRRADGSSSFMFCNAIDDSLMGVTHVLRGEDHLTNTPRQLLILHALKMRTAQYGHLSMITGDDGSPLSKRHGSSSLHDLRERGYLPVAVLNYLARLSHAYDDQHLMSFVELAKNFRLEKLSRAPARFDLNQLLHWQKEAVMVLDNESAWLWLGEDIKNRVPAPVRDLFIDVVRHNVHFPEEARQWEEILFGSELTFSENQINILKSAGAAFFIESDKAVQQHQTDLKSIFNELKTNLNVSGKNLFMPVRLALTGQEHGPELVNIVNLLGADKMRERFQQALELAKE